MPAAVAPWNITAQPPVASKVQVRALNEPPVVPALRVKVTVPDGILEAVVVSVTVAVHDEVWPVLIELGLHDTLVEVLSFAGAVT